MEKLSNEINYTTVVKSHSTPVFRDVSPQGTSSASLNATSSVGPYEFLINPAVFNIARSKLCFRLNIPAVTSKFLHINDNGLSKMSRVVLYDNATNAIWADISNVSQYASQIRGATSLDELLTKSTYAGAVKTTATAADLVPLEDLRKTNAATGVDLTNTAIGAENPFTSVRYSASSAAGAAVAVRYEIPLGAFKLSAFATDKMIYSPSNLTVQVYFAGTNSFGNSSDSADPTDTEVALTGVTVDDIKLRLYNEGNLSIVSQVIDKVSSSGLEIPICYPTTTRQTIASGTSHSYQLNLSSGYGQRILAILTSPFQTGTYVSTVSDKGNITSYNTFLDNIAIKYPPGFNASKGEHWTIGNRAHFEKSAIENGAQYDLDFTHVDSFVGAVPLHEIDVNAVDGFSVADKMATFAWQATLSSAASSTYLSTIIGQKMLKLTSSGSSVV